MIDTPFTDEFAYDVTSGEKSVDGVVNADIVRRLEKENTVLYEAVAYAFQHGEFGAKALYTLEKYLIAARNHRHGVGHSE